MNWFEQLASRERGIKVSPPPPPFTQDWMDEQTACGRTGQSRHDGADLPWNSLTSETTSSASVNGTPRTPTTIPTGSIRSPRKSVNNETVRKSERGDDFGLGTGGHTSRAVRIYESNLALVRRLSRYAYGNFKKASCAFKGVLESRVESVRLVGSHRDASLNSDTR